MGGMSVSNRSNTDGMLQRWTDSLEQPCELRGAELCQERGDGTILITRSREIVGEPATRQTRRDLGVHPSRSTHRSDEGAFKQT